MSAFIPTQEQEQILRHPANAHGCILAGPGAGKSSTVVEYLLRLLGTENKSRVRLLTFTRAATNELIGKVSDQTDTKVAVPPLSTIHSFAISVLMQNPGSGGLVYPIRIADDWEKKYIVHKTLRRQLSISEPEVKKLFKEMAANWESLAPDEDKEIDPNVRRRFQGVWGEHREIYGYTHVSELPFGLRNALEHHPELAGLDYELLIVDEYQDLNACDLEVIKRISQRGCTILACGDDDQSIYGFRKAHPVGIRRFANDYAGAPVFNLTNTRRCGTRIIEWANHVIRQDTSRSAARPTILPGESAPQGEAALLAFRVHTAEANGVAQIVKKLIEVEKIQPPDILILFRGDHNGMFSTPIKEALEREGIAYADPNHVERVLGESSNRKAIALAHLLSNPTDHLAWATLLSLQVGINTDSTLDAVYARAREDGTSFTDAMRTLYAEGFPALPAPSRRAASELIDNVQEWLGRTPLPEETPEDGWGNWLIATTGTSGGFFSITEEFKEILRNLDTHFSEKNVEPSDLGRFLGQLEPVGEDLQKSRSEGVRLMSMVSSKGLTAEACVIVGVDDDIVMGHDTQNEACRLLYVAMTRAKKYVFATWARRRRGPTAHSGRGNAAQPIRHPSRFFDGGPVHSEEGTDYIARRWNNL